MTGLLDFGPLSGGLLGLSTKRKIFVSTITGAIAPTTKHSPGLSVISTR
jgi:hypothetical protein